MKITCIQAIDFLKSNACQFPTLCEKNATPRRGKIYRLCLKRPHVADKETGSVGYCLLCCLPQVMRLSEFIRHIFQIQNNLAALRLHHPGTTMRCSIATDNLTDENGEFVSNDRRDKFSLFITFRPVKECHETKRSR